MKNIFKLSFLMLFTSSIMISCAEDEEIAPFNQLFVAETFEAHAYGSGTTEIPIEVEGWINHNTKGTRQWICKIFSNNRFAEFSSFYSTAATASDETWLITPKMDFTTLTNETMSFRSQARFSNGAELKVLYSTDFDGTVEGIETATWTPIEAVLPTVDNIFIESGFIDLSSIEGNNVYVAFRYTGSKPQNKTTTFQLDDIKFFENK